MRETPKPYERYRHFKGNLYQIIAIATHSETEEELVIYQALYGDYKIYARPLSMFLEKVDKEKYPDVSQEYRFQSVNQVAEKTPEAPVIPATPDFLENNLDPQVLAFLEADSYQERLNILAGLHHRITADMLTTMAVACDLELSQGDLEGQYMELKNCLLTLEKYECNRIR